MCVQTRRSYSRKRNVTVDLDGVLYSVPYSVSKKLQDAAIYRKCPVVREIPKDFSYARVSNKIYSNVDVYEFEKILDDLLEHNCFENALIKSFPYELGVRVINASTKSLGYDPTLKEVFKFLENGNKIPRLGKNGIEKIKDLCWSFEIH